MAHQIMSRMADVDVLSVPVVSGIEVGMTNWSRSVAAHEPVGLGGEV